MHALQEGDRIIWRDPSEHFIAGTVIETKLNHITIHWDHGLQSDLTIGYLAADQLTKIPNWRQHP